jgi:hypothetical protein
MRKKADAAKEANGMKSDKQKGRRKKLKKFWHCWSPNHFQANTKDTSKLHTVQCKQGRYEDWSDVSAGKLKDIVVVWKIGEFREKITPISFPTGI